MAVLIPRHSNRVSIHAPLTGGDMRLGVTDGDRVVSIHAPLTGGDRTHDGQVNVH